MKRMWCGVGLLILLLVLGILAFLYTDSLEEQLLEAVQNAADAAQVGQWEKSAGELYRAKDFWDRHHHRMASVADHEPMEEAEGLFAQLEIYLKAKDAAAFSACCAALRTTVRAIGETQGFNWWNIL